MYDAHAVVLQPLRQTANGMAHPARLERLAESLYADDEAFPTLPRLDNHFLMQSGFLYEYEEHVTRTDERPIGIEHDRRASRK